jgi:hypothetical protein
VQWFLDRTVPPLLPLLPQSSLGDPIAPATSTAPTLLYATVGTVLRTSLLVLLLYPPEHQICSQWHQTSPTPADCWHFIGLKTTPPSAQLREFSMPFDKVIVGLVKDRVDNFVVGFMSEGSKFEATIA